MGKNSKLHIIFILFLVLSINCFSQDFSGYKYVYIPTLTYQNGTTDSWGIASQVENFFKSKGLKVSRGNNLPQEVNTNPCVFLNCSIDHTSVISGYNSVTIKLFNCNNQIVFENSAKAMGMSLQADYKKATSKALKPLDYLRYSFRSENTPKLNLPSVEQTGETEESLKAYFSSNTIDQIEGIYQSYQNESLNHYKIGIKKAGSTYKAIILESSFSWWKVGEVKAIFTPTAMAGMYALTFYISNKSSVETFATLEKGAILNIEFIEPDGSKSQSQFLKLYPSSNGEVTSNSAKTGSGFVVTSNGIIGTNAHVIAGSSSITCSFTVQNIKIEYEAKLLLIDEDNDVALLQISDSKFQGFNPLPYGFSESLRIGENVFTIGFPLNDVMGENYKVTNGIISSSSGIKDDPRFLQTTVAIQPGNSGGALFNSNGDIIGITTATLNENAVGTSVQNVNFAIKVAYLSNLFEMLPDQDGFNSPTQLNGKQLSDQIEIVKDYVCLINAK